jgi:hypothetical protein
MKKLRWTLLVAVLSVTAWALPRPSSAFNCEILCWTQGNETCWQTGTCVEKCCVTGSPGCFSPCD